MKQKVDCLFCQDSKTSIVEGEVRDNPSIGILKCTNCGLVFLDTHEHISDHYYEDSRMHGQDLPPIPEVLIETAADDERRFSYLRDNLANKRLLDYGSGAGGFLIKAKKFAASCCALELESRYLEHYRQRNIDLYHKLEDIPLGICYDIITMFHVLEHLKDPIKTLSQLKYRLCSGGELFIEVPHANDALLSVYKSECFSKFTYWGAHLYLFTPHTLELLAKKVGLRVKFIKQVQRYPLSNHIGWLVDGKPGGHQKYNFLDTPELRSAYQATLSSLGVCDTLICKFMI